MKVDITKVKLLTKNRGMTIDQLCKKCKIGRSTFWRWQNNHTNPKQKDIINIAKVLEVDPTIFTTKDAENQTKTPVIDIPTDNSNNYLKLYHERFNRIIHELHSLNNSMESIVTLISGILENSDIAFYAKNKQLKYVIANAAFLNHLKLSRTYSVFNKTDADLLSKKEAVINTKEDELVFISKNPVVNKEDYIVGTHKKKWGLISKLPIFDQDHNEVGVIGMIIDITDKKRNEKIKDILSFGLNQTSCNIAIRFQDAHKFLFHTKNYKEIFGFDYDISIDFDKSAKKYVYEKDKQFVIKSLQDFYSGSEDYTEIIFRIFGEHTHYKMRWMKFLLKKFDFLGQTCYLRIAKDITEETEKNIKIKTTYHIFNKFKKTMVSIAHVNLNSGFPHKVFFVSENSKKITGYTPDYFYNSKHPFNSLLDNSHNNVLSNMELKETNYEYEIIINKKDGEKVWCVININYFEENNNWYCAIVLTDINDIKNSHQKIDVSTNYDNKIKTIIKNLSGKGFDIKTIAEVTELPTKKILSLLAENKD